MFSAATQKWFDENFDAPTEIQKKAWPLLGKGKHTLLIAPTGSGKTLAAFLSAIDALVRAGDTPAAGVTILYISPLKALVHDIERNLRLPLVGIQHECEKLEQPMRRIRIDVRTGDTSQRDRRIQARAPGDILVTTPESLYLLLGSKAGQNLVNVQTVIVDEIHSLAPTKRGVHLALSLERLSMMARQDPQRVGLSATLKPPAEAAAFLGGDRKVEIVDTSVTPRMDLTVSVPVQDMTNPLPPPTDSEINNAINAGHRLAPLQAHKTRAPQSERGIWPMIYPRLLEHIRKNNATIIFVNSRSLCERLAQKLNELAEDTVVRAHHGSVSHERRIEIEEQLKTAQLKAVVATSSLELGIDMGAVDSVLMMESPGSVARGLQRIGRAGHGVGQLSKGVIYPKFRGDLLESAIIAQRMQSGEIEALRIPANALDVLSQQLVAICAQQNFRVRDLIRIIKRAYPYKNLSEQALESVLDMLSGRYPSTDFSELRPLLNWDRSTDEISPRKGAAMAARMNAGTIPERGMYGMYLAAGEDKAGARVGELDEEMVFETRAGENILLGASSWRVEQITRDRVIVSPAPGEPGKLPFWHGAGPGRSLELGIALGGFLRKLGTKPRAQCKTWLLENTPLDELASDNLAGYIFEQKQQTGVLPTDKAITVERFVDELGDWRICILSPFGARIHAPWAMALQQAMSARSGFDVQVMYTDDGMVLRMADAEDLPALDSLLPDPDEVEDFIIEQLAHTSLFAGLFRENAVRSLILRRHAPGRRTPLWAQRLKSQNLLAAVKSYPGFPIVVETYRAALADQFDLPGLKTILRGIRSRKIRVNEVHTQSASPFSMSLVFAYVASYLYEQDQPLAERRAQALTLDRNLLSQLLGQAELRELIDADVLEEIEAERQQLTPERKAKTKDHVHDLCLRLGDLSAAEVFARCVEKKTNIRKWLQELTKELRLIKVKLAGETRFIAAAEAGLFRDTFAIELPSDLPQSYIGTTSNPLEQIVRRYAHTHGPFLMRDLCVRYNIRAPQLEPVLNVLEKTGVLVLGGMRPHGSEMEWCDANVLRSIKRRTLAKLRNEATAVEAGTLGLFLPQWQGVNSGRQGLDWLQDVLLQLEGCRLLWSSLNEIILPARVKGFRADMLDTVTASGRFVWIGHGASGARDGRIAIYTRNHLSQLLELESAYAAPTGMHQLLLEHLAQHGASFLMELEDAARKAPKDLIKGGFSKQDFETVLWDLVWAGQITNDSFQPLRALSTKTSRSRSGRRQLNPLAGGRWSLTSRLVTQAVSETEKVLSHANVLLERYGIVSRGTSRAENIKWASVYKVMRAMEESGKIRRGYFVEGFGGTQFAYAYAVDGLRSMRADNAHEFKVPIVTVLSNIDPANPFGALLPWPELMNANEIRPRRIASACTVLVNGWPILAVSGRGRKVAVFNYRPVTSDEILTLAFTALGKYSLPGNKKHSIVIEQINAQAVRESSLFELVLGCGYVSDYKGLSSHPLH